tara:strand:+ start:701 stop:964 length:264 start_codon:yes stop_codon:yes gene_type:complete
MADTDTKTVTLYCMTSKKKFDVVNPPVVVLKNGRFAYRAMCPDKGKDGKDLYAFKFCSAADHKRYESSNTATSECPSPPESTPPTAE